MTYYISGESVYNDPNYYVSVFIHDAGYPDADYGTASAKIEALGVADDPFWSLGVETVDPPGPFVRGEKQAEFGLLYGYRFKADVNSCWAWDNVGFVWVDLLAGGAPHVRLHAMTSAQDHNANQWKMWYSDGGGPPAQVQEVALGVAGTLIKSAGPAAPPTFTTHSLDNAFDHGKEIDGANSIANAVKIGDGADKFNLYALGGKIYLEVIGGGDIVLKDGNIVADGLEKVYDAVWN